MEIIDEKIIHWLAKYNFLLAKIFILKLTHKPELNSS
jgi:hypothetical protein